MSIKVIGAGLGRTGTMSLKRALEHLYGEKCFHMVELLRQPERLKYLKKPDVVRKANWDKTFEGFGAVTDFPCCIYYRELAELYPEAKVILTIWNQRDLVRLHTMTTIEWTGVPVTCCCSTMSCSVDT